MKTDRRTRERALTNPPAETILVHGADTGGIDAAIARLLAGAELIRLTGAEVRADPGLLRSGSADLFAARRAIRVDEADDNLTKAVSDLLDAGGPPERLVIRAGVLKAKSRLRKLVEGHKNAVAIQLAEPDPGEIDKLITDTLGAQADAQARQALVARLPRDRGAIRSELDKLSLFAGDRRITADLVTAAVADATEETIDQVLAATFNGDPAGSARAIRRLESDGTAWMQVLRATAIHADSLRRLHNGLGSGESLNDALKRLKPPAFGARRDALTRQIRAWDQNSLDRALARIDAAEAEAKTGQIPPELVLKHLMWAISLRARQLHRKGPARR